MCFSEAILAEDPGQKIYIDVKLLEILKNSFRNRVAYLFMQNWTLLD